MKRVLTGLALVTMLAACGQYGEIQIQVDGEKIVGLCNHRYSSGNSYYPLAGACSTLSTPIPAHPPRP